MAGVFISYRRSDSPGFARLLHERLSASFGADRVFIDVDGLEPGVDFVTVLEDKMSACDVVVAVIGREWQAERLADANDFVRLELATALGKSKRVIPVLVEDASMPAARDLPTELQPLLRRQALEVSHAQFHRDADGLVRAVERAMSGTGTITVQTPRPPQAMTPGAAPGGQRRMRMLALAGLGAVLAGVLYWKLGTMPAAGRDPQVTAERKPAMTNPKDGLTYVWIPAGAFMMGCSPGDSQCDAAFEQRHRVTLTRGYWMGQTEVTQGAWRKLMGVNPSERKGDDLPVEQVGWEEANDYCAKIGGRLPTEAEWEYAARGGSEEMRYGEVLDIAVIADDSGRERIPASELWERNQNEYIKKIEENGNGPKPVRTKAPNAYGLYDMLGNVHEWTADYYAPYGDGPVTDPRGANASGFRVVRGGAWSVPRWYSRASTRVRVQFAKRDNDLGFRCVGRWP